jgi:NCS1 family nucleobase:cation symporter-1
VSTDPEFDHKPVPANSLAPKTYIAANYAGEHIAGTEFVIGAAFVAWGVSAGDLIVGLLLGNLLAVLSWALLCAPVAVDTRLTLYAYLQKIAGPGVVRLYSVINGLLFCILAGSMITVSASAVRIPFGIAPQTNIYPSDPLFILVALAVGAVVVVVAVMGFRRLAQFASVVTPWMVAMFFVGALFLYPVLMAAEGVSGSPFSPGTFWQVAENRIWVGSADSGFTLWHVAAFAWVANLAMHGGMSDMSLLRYARKASYGYFSALGMFIGHFAAWICAGIMGAGAALLLGRSITALDAGEVAYQALGTAGILAVIIAGWTTSNPTLYRAGLAFQSLNPAWSRKKVTAVVGVVTTVIACFPFVFTGLLDFVGLMGLLLVPVGAVILTEHWLFPRLGLNRYWFHYSGRSFSLAALGAWVGGLLVALAAHTAGLHLFFLLLPTFAATTVVYILLAALTGARRPKGLQQVADERAEGERKAAERLYLEGVAVAADPRRPGALMVALSLVAAAALLSCIGAGVWLLVQGPASAAPLAAAQGFLIVPTVVFLATAAWISMIRARGATDQ